MRDDNRGELRRIIRAIPLIEKKVNYAEIFTEKAEECQTIINL